MSENDWRKVPDKQLLFLKKSMRSGNHNFKEAQTTVEFLLGPIKIKDGLFMGDQFAAKDIEFIISNKVTHVVNTVAKSIPNLYERFGIQYLSVHWTQKEENIFDKKNNAVNAIFQFVEQAMEAGESCLIHSMHGKSRACAVLVAYLMRKYSWSLNKSLQFVNSKKEGLEIRNNYLVQMQQLQKRMMHDHKLSMSWNQIKNEEDLILSNTFYNSKKAESSISQPAPKKSKKRVEWPEKLVQKIVNPHAATHTAGFLQEKVVTSTANLKLKSILKGDQQPEKQSENDFEREVEPKKDKNSQDDRFMSTINGNIVHVTVNNFIQAEKPTHETSNRLYNTRPYSSDAKERDKKAQNIPGKMFPSDSGMSSTYKNPYERHVMGKLGVNLRTHKKHEDKKNLMMIYDRPVSAKTTQDKRKGAKLPLAQTPIAQKLGFDMMAMSSAGKRRYPSTAHKEEPYKWK